MSKQPFNAKDDFQTANMLGLYNGVGAASSFALEENMTADTPVIIGTGTPTPLLPPDTGVFLELFSPNTDNDGALIVIDVLDVDFMPVTVALAELSGVGPNPLLHPDTNIPFLITRVNNARNVGARGTGEVGVDLTIRSVPTPANVYGTITAASQEMQQAIFTVPANVKWAVSSLVTSMRKSIGADTDVLVTLVGGAVGTVLRRVFSFGLQRSGDTALEFMNSELQGFGSPADLMLEGEASTTGTGLVARINIRTVEVGV